MLLWTRATYSADQQQAPQAGHSPFLDSITLAQDRGHHKKLERSDKMHPMCSNNIGNQDLAPEKFDSFDFDDMTALTIQDEHHAIWEC